ncbi:MAG: extracellular solute-binding protein [Deltaproteobacteria bacterium]|nr:extracellular solute-binding protein [Deltaproteobacteria bacterium]
MATKKRPTAMIAPTLILILWSWLACADAFAASASSALLKAKQEAESKGYVFFTNHDEILSKAQKEGKLRIQASLDESMKATTEAFRKRYPLIDLHVESLRGFEAAHRFLLEIKAGAAKDWDITRTPTDSSDFYREVLPHLWKVDLLGMAEHGVFDVPPKMIDPKNRNVIGWSSRFAVVPYNKNLVSPDQVPKSWEDMLEPKWKGRKFGNEISPQEIAALVPAWGLEKTLDYARKIAAQQPIWSRGSARPLAALAAGEVPLLLFGANYGQVRVAQRKDLLGVIQSTVLEPVPVRIGMEHGILSTSRNLHAALLWLEFMVGAEAQKLIDQHELVASLYSKDSTTEKALRGKKVSVVSWETNEKMEQWIAKLIEAYGFPKAELKK